MKYHWPMRALGEVSKIIMGQSPDGRSYNAKGQGVPLINGPVEFSRGSFGHTVRTKFTTEPTKLCRTGDLILCVRGSTTGRTNIAAFDACIGRGVAVIRARDYQPWINYAIRWKRDDIYNLGTGSTFPNVSASILSQIPVLCPPVPEQQRIVAILDEAFEGIATARANAEKNLQNARAVFENHLRAVFCEGADRLGPRIPLESALAVQPRNGWSPPAEYQTGTGFPVLTLSAVTGFEYGGERVKLTSAPVRENAHYWLNDGELLITRSNTRELVGHVAIYDGTPSRAICCDLIMKMMVNPSKADTRFVYYFLRSPEARSYFTSRAQGASSTMKKIGKAVVQGIPVPLPGLTVQRSIVETLDALGEETRRLQSIYCQKLAALEELKKSLLHRAFSGEL